LAIEIRTFTNINSWRYTIDFDCFNHYSRIAALDL